MPENLRRRPAGARGWLIPAALLALAPKCALCILAYAGLGTALGLGGPEICGDAGTDSSWATVLPVLSVAMVAALILAGRSRRLKRDSGHFAGNTSSSSTSKIRPENGGMLPTCMFP